MRAIRIFLALLSVAAGVAIGALNPQSVVLDLGVAAVPTTLGVLVLSTLLLGALAGGAMLLASVVLPMRQRLRRARAEASRSLEGG